MTLKVIILILNRLHNVKHGKAVSSMLSIEKNRKQKMANNTLRKLTERTKANNYEEIKIYIYFFEMTIKCSDTILSLKC